MATSISGLITGLDTDQLIEGLLAVDRQRIQTIKGKQTKFTTEQTAFKSVEARLVTLQGQISQLARPQNGALDVRTVSSSNKDLVTAAAGSAAAPGVYTVRVNSLARAQQIASQGFDSANSILTQGTLQLKVGSGATTTITIDSTNNTLQGLANAITGSAAGVTATIINDGSDSRTQPYRLLLTANKSGLDNAITLTNALAADAGGARRVELSGTYTGAATTSASYTGTATPTSNAGASTFTGTANTTYKFTVVTGGTVGSDNNLQIAYADSTGSNTGTLALESSDADVFKNVAQGIQIKLSAGTLVAGQTFTVDGFVANVQSATNAAVSVGSGSGALTVESASNQIDGILNGITLNLQGADSTKEVTLTVSTDTERARKAIQGFVDAYNDLLKFVDEQVRYDPETKKAGVLLGNRRVTGLEDEVRRAVTGAVAGVNPLANRLSVLGITINAQGRLDSNQGRLDSVLNGQVAGVAVEDVRRLFALAGSSTNAGVQFVTGSPLTKASPSPLQVDLSQAAEQATLTATDALAAATVIDNTNNTITLTVDGKTSSTITLASGTYTRANLAQELQAKINANADLVGRQVSASVVNDKLTVTSHLYGYTSEVKVVSGSALAALGLAGTESDRGQDVVGKFVVDGVAETAVGTGQFLAGSSSNKTTADLQIRVTLSASQIQEGPEASLTVTRGVASKVDRVLTNLLEPANGRLKSINDGYKRNIDDAQKQVEKQETVVKARQKALLRQFVALETTVSNLQAAGSFLGAQQLNIKSLRSGG